MKKKEKENEFLAFVVLMFYISTIAVGAVMMVSGLSELVILADLSIFEGIAGLIEVAFLTLVFLAGSIACMSRVAWWLYEPAFNFVGFNSFFSIRRKK